MASRKIFSRGYGQPVKKGSGTAKIRRTARKNKKGKK